MENLETKFVELIEKFEMLAVNLAPEALELGLAVARVAAAQQAIILILAASVFFWSVRKPFHYFGLMLEIEKEKGDRYLNNEENKAFAYGVASTIIAVISGAITFASISIWPFVGIFYPELWIAKRVLGW